MWARLKVALLGQGPVGSCNTEAAAEGMFGEPGTQTAHFGSFERNVGAFEFV